MTERKKADAQVWSHKNRDLKGHLKDSSYYGKTKASKSLKGITYATLILHDLGKSTKTWQSYLRESLANNKSHFSDKIPHASSILHTKTDLGAAGIDPAKVSAISLLGCKHHSGLNINDPRKYFENRDNKNPLNPSDKEEIDNFITSQMADSKEDFFKGIAEELDSNDFEKLVERYGDIAIRMALGSITYADHIDAALPGKKKSQAEAKQKKDFSIEKAIENSENWFAKNRNFSNPESLDQVNKVRTEASNEVYANISSAIKEGHKYFSITLPTGAGKTETALRAAVKVLKEQNKERLFYVNTNIVPTVQNAEKMRELFGKTREFHSDAILEKTKETEDDEKYYSSLTSHWQYPVIATTLVSFFESFYSTKNKKISKLPSLNNSLIIFDEPQTYPIKHNPQYLRMIDYLITEANATVILITATPATFQKKSDNYDYFLEGATEYLNVPKFNILPKELVENIDYYFNSFDRVNLKYLSHKEGLSNFDDIVDLLQSNIEKRQIAIFNTTKQAALAANALKEKGINAEIFSGRKTKKDRQETLDKYKSSKLEHPILIATSSLQQGVDVSCDVLYRAMCPVDSFIQSIGRCNRSLECKDLGGSPTKGLVYLFDLNDAEKLRHFYGFKSQVDAFKKYLGDDLQAASKLTSDLFLPKTIESFNESNQSTFIDEDYLRDIHKSSYLRIDQGMDKWTSPRGGDDLSMDSYDPDFKKIEELCKIIENDTSITIVNQASDEGVVTPLRDELEAGISDHSLSKSEFVKILNELSYYSANVYMSKKLIKDFLEDGSLQVINEDDYDDLDRRASAEMFFFVKKNTTETGLNYDSSVGFTW